MPDMIFPLSYLLSWPSLFGLFAVGCVFLWPFLPNTGAMLLVQTLGAGSFAAHFMLIGAETAAWTSSMAVFQLFAVRFLRSSLQVHLCFVMSAVVLATIAVQSWHGIPSVLALLGCFLASMARLQKVPRIMKLGFLASTPFWIVHNIMVGSVFGSAVDVVSLTGNLGSFWRSKSIGEF